MVAVRRDREFVFKVGAIRKRAREIDTDQGVITVRVLGRSCSFYGKGLVASACLISSTLLIQGLQVWDTGTGYLKSAIFENSSSKHHNILLRRPMTE
jgi:hypothetical protein